MPPKQHWILKTEPSTYSWSDLVTQGRATWDGVRNFAARNHLRAMGVGDTALVYHSGNDKAVVGVVEITKAAYPDASATDGDWSAVDLRPLRALKRPVTLAELKSTPTLAKLVMLKQSRLSVSPCSPIEFEQIVKLGG